MAAFPANSIQIPRRKPNILIPVAILWGLALLIGFGFLWVTGAFSESMENLYLLPWVTLLGVVVLAPSVYLWYQGKFDLFHPLVYAAWTYLFPAFVIGGVLLNLELVDWYFLIFIEDPQYNVPLTLVYITIGVAGLIVGYYLPLGKFAADKLDAKLPLWDWKPDNVWLAGVLLVMIGVGANVLAFLQGLVGFQQVDVVEIFDGLISFLVIVLTAGVLLLWIALFSAKKRNGAFYLVLLMMLAFIPLRMAILGNRSGLIASLIPIVFAYAAAGRKFKLKQTVLFSVLAVVAVFVGLIYGTTFRQLKGSDRRVEASSYISQIAETVDYIAARDPVTLFGGALQDLAQRVENLSSVAVVVSNYEKLAPYEESYGLQNNIMNDLYTSFIPRFVWPDKPSTSNPRAYSDLYFDYGENSFAISPFADLLRNFGVIGIPLGMLLVGVYLRLIYSLFIETQFPSMWKKVAYFLLLTCISYEGFYGTLFPTVIRTAVVLAFTFAIANLFARRGSLKGMARG